MKLYLLLSMSVWLINASDEHINHCPEFGAEETHESVTSADATDGSSEAGNDADCQKPENEEVFVWVEENDDASDYSEKTADFEQTAPAHVVVVCCGNDELANEACQEGKGWLACAKDMAVSISSGALIGLITGYSSHQAELAQFPVLASWIGTGMARQGLVDGVNSAFNKYGIKHNKDIVRHISFIVSWATYIANGHIWQFVHEEVVAQ